MIGTSSSQTAAADVGGLDGLQRVCYHRGQHGAYWVLTDNPAPRHQARSEGGDVPEKEDDEFYAHLETKHHGGGNEIQSMGIHRSRSIVGHMHRGSIRLDTGSADPSRPQR